ncbi:MAG: YitT family protein [Erysipelotrichaceae bacterium]
MMNKLKKVSIKTIIQIMIGAIILAFGTYNFNFQNHITEGGILGLLLLFKNIFSISPSFTSVVIDFTLFMFGAKYFGKKFLLYSLLSTLSFSLSYKVFEKIGYIAPSLENNMLLASVMAGLFVGIGVGIIVRAGGAAGGDDVIALVGTKFTKLKINQVYLLSDLIVLGLSLCYLSFNQIFYSILAVCISGKVIALIYNDN